MDGGRNKRTNWNLLGLPVSELPDWKVNRFTLIFSGKLKKHEPSYRDFYFYRSLNPFRFSIALGIIFFDVFAILDALLLPELRNTFWLIRFGFITPFLLLVILFSYTAVFKKVMQIIMGVAMYFSGLAIIVMDFLAGRTADHYTYYAGLILVFIFGYAFVKASFISASIAGWSIVLTYEIAAVFFIDTPDLILLNNNYFFISSNIIGMFIGYFLEVSSRRDYYMQVLLESEQEKVKNANIELEMRVEERTEQLTIANKDLQKEIERRKQNEKEKALMEAQLFQLQKMETIGTLAGGVAHDFNNILTPIMGYTDMALEELSEENPLREDIQYIKSCAVRGKNLVQQILTFSRQVDYDLKPLHLDAIIIEALGMTMGSRPSNIEIRQQLDPDAGAVLADSTQMHQIVMNLITNSYHAMAESGGILEVKLMSKEMVNKGNKSSDAGKSGTYVCLQVSDTGYGMDEQTKSRIFEPFFTSKEVGSGSGLGLSVVHGIVTNGGGFIEVESEKNSGTTFSVYLPQYSFTESDEKAISEKLVRGTGSIIFVDDEEEITVMGKKMLESLGYEVEGYTDGNKALAAIAKNVEKYDLLVTDQSMPAMSGTELIEKARQLKPGLKSIIITGYYDALPKDAWSNENISEILLKPLILSYFSKYINKVLTENAINSDTDEKDSDHR